MVNYGFSNNVLPIICYHCGLRTTLQRHTIDSLDSISLDSIA